MQVSNTETIAGYRIVQTHGVATGNTVRAKNVARDFLANLKNIVGGEVRGYTEMLSEARDEATHRMLQAAKSLGANAVVNVRFTTSSVAEGMSEMLAYGTAVTVEPES